MGLDTRRPPLPAPTESMDETSGPDTEVGTTLTMRTDKTSYSIPEDGSPITIPTHKLSSSREGLAHHGRQKSQTSLLIEYFEASKTGDKSRNRPSVRVKVTPSASKKARSGSDSIQITGIGSDRKPSYTRRITLGDKESGSSPLIGTELSHSSGSVGSPPVEIEVLNGSDLSNARSSRGLLYAPTDSNISSMPPDSLLEGRHLAESDISRARDGDDESTIKDSDFLRAPSRDRSRSASRERLTQKVMEKLGASSKTRKSSRSSRERSLKEEDYAGHTRERRRRSSKTQRSEDDHISGAESSLVSSNKSHRSGASQVSQMTNNPKLLEMVEDTIKRVILPEIFALKEDQKTQKHDRNLRSFDQSRHATSTSGKEGYDGLERRVSKSSSSPNIASKPKVVLNREGDDPGITLSRGDSERIKSRKSSREARDEYRPSSRKSSGKHSRRTSQDVEGQDMLAAAIAGGALTAAALKHHDSQNDMHERRKRRSKSRGSRSRSASLAEAAEEAYTTKDASIPPLPLASHINDSEVTRESILSDGTERIHRKTSGHVRTPTREFSRGSLDGPLSPTTSRTPTRTPVSRILERKQLQRDADSPGSPVGSNNTSTVKSRAGAYTKTMDEIHMDADGYGSPVSQRRVASPTQSVSSLKKNFENDPLVPQGLRPRSVAERSSANPLYGHKDSRTSLRTAGSTPNNKLADSRKQSRDVSGDEFITPLEHPRAALEAEDILSPGGETADEWFERQHAVNDRYRNSFGESNRDSYQTNPYPQDERRYTTYTEDSLEQRAENGQNLDENAVHSVVAKKGMDHGLVTTPAGVESAVASLMEPSIVSSNLVSSSGSPSKANGSYSDRVAEHARAFNKDSPAIYEGSTLSQTMSSGDRWAAIRGHARELSASTENVRSMRSPTQSPAKDLRDSVGDQPKLTASGLPIADDPMPEIGHYDSNSDLTTNPSIIQGPLGGDPTGNDTWPYTPDPARGEGASFSHHKPQSNSNAIADGALAGAGVALAGAALEATRKPDASNEIDGAREYTPDLGRNRHVNPLGNTMPNGSPAAFRDEGYVTDAQTRSREALTPSAEQVYRAEDIDAYEAAMNAHDDDPFTAGPTHTRHFSANSHGMGSPLYDSSTGKGLDRIQSKDIVALMDHLTVRDAQRNARDTEILVTLVRSAAEMRQSFDEMKRFIVEQDKLIMRNADRNGDQVVQKVLNGPRPQPFSSPRTSRNQSEDEVQTKRKGVLRRALKGLTGGKSANDLTKIEDMLIQILDNVEDLKSQTGGARPTGNSFSNDSLDSYEKLRGALDAGYEPEGQAGTSSTPSQSGQLLAGHSGKQQFHSGYDGRRGSPTRVSTVVEDDEDEIEPHEAHVLGHQFENNERMLTPTQEIRHARGLSPSATPPQQAATFPSPDKQRKHKSNGSSIFGIPKVSRWSKTTSSSAAPDSNTFDSPNQANSQGMAFKPGSEASRSGLALDQYGNEYEVPDGDHLRSTQSLVREQERDNARAEARSVRSQASRLTRTPSPLIPSEVSARDHEYNDDDDDYDGNSFDDPKYQAHRNSLLLEHPQPRQGPTPRHQNALESQAYDFDDTTGTNSDLSQRTVSDFDPAVWGSSGTAGLARHKLTNFEPISPVSMNSPKYGKQVKDDGPLVPQPKANAPSKSYYQPEPEDWEPQFSNSGFSKGGYYSSPYGSGHLLEPIEEVRYSLETDRSSHRDQSFSPEPQVAQAVDMRSPTQRKITGPRPMGSRSPAPATQQARLVEAGGTVRRKPIPRSDAGSEGSAESESF